MDAISADVDVHAINSDLCLHIIRFLNVKDSARFSRTSKRFYYLVKEFQRLRGPEIAVAASGRGSRSEDSRTLFRSALDRLQQPPNLVLSFAASDDEEDSPVVGSKAHFLGSVATDVQVVLPDGTVRCDSERSVLVGAFPRAQIRPFGIRNSEEVQRKVEALRSKTDHPWKACIVYASGDGRSFVDDVVRELQAAMPGLIIVGGICDACRVLQSEGASEAELNNMTIRQLRGVVRDHGRDPTIYLEKRELVEAARACLSQGRVETVEGTVQGVLLGGEIPMRSIVSRGVESCLQGEPQPNSPYVVEQTHFVRPGDDEYIFRAGEGMDDDELEPYHLITTVKNRETNKVISAMELMRLSSMTQRPQYIGLRRPSEDGFYIDMITPYSYPLRAYLIMPDGRPGHDQSLMGAHIDLYYLHGPAMIRDIKKTVADLKEQTKHEQILGAVMFSCNGRGPSPNQMLPEEMADAKQFASAFPGVPCLGCYCGGEIGPLAMVGKKQVFQSGNAAVQGFTAVFAIFIVPAPTDRPRCHLDDSPDNVTRFVRDNLIGRNA